MNGLPVDEEPKEVVTEPLASGASEVSLSVGAWCMEWVMTMGRRRSPWP